MGRGLGVGRLTVGMGVRGMGKDDGYEDGGQRGGRGGDGTGVVGKGDGARWRGQNPKEKAGEQQSDAQASRTQSLAHE